MLRSPEHLVAEIVDGELYLSPRPTPRHAFTTTSLGMDLAPFTRGRGGPGGWWILDEPEVHFGDDVLVPDLAGWREGRLQGLPETAYFTLAPDWVCEVLSPSTERLDRARKLPVYGRERVPYVWLVDPIVRTLEVLTLSGGDWTIHAIHSEHDRARIVPFEAIEIDLALLWSDQPTAE